MTLPCTTLSSCFHLFSDPTLLIQAVGYLGLILIVFAETGLLVGFFLPGDSLLVSAGLLAQAGHFSLLYLMVSLTLAAIIGDSVGFTIGRGLGSLLLKRKDSFFFRKRHLEMAQDFYTKNGGKTIFFARFIPIIRTFAPTVAGAAGMNYMHFSLYNVFGGLTWVCSTTGLGYFLGHSFGDKIQDSLHILIICIVLISLIPVFLEWRKTRKARK